MSRSTIDFGIDLGTTNSTIAVMRETGPEVIPNQEGAVLTPSAVWIDRRGQARVGRVAKERIEKDPSDTAAEFKLRMGEGAQAAKAFAQSGRSLLPEELSAEVLKSLREDVRQHLGEEVTAAAITVPAAFDLPACNATRRAAELAGLSPSPLLQEPVAAALAYGFQCVDERVFWLVYDFGGGTFDAAIVRVCDGLIQVVNHAGDNFLGGKLMDWEIVERKLAPALTARYALGDFRRANDRWRTALSRLKAEAESAKIQVSRSGRPCLIAPSDPVCTDERGQPVELEYELTPQEVEEIAAPYVARSIGLCLRACAEKGLSPGDIEKALMVGGTGLLPSLREQFQRETGIAMDFHIDPMTVVARGAAVFAGTQRRPRDAAAEAPANQYQVAFECEAAGADTDPPVGGRVVPPPGRSVRGCTIAFAESRGLWRGAPVPVADSGVFMAEVHAERGRTSEFRIELLDPAGNRLETAPPSFRYTAIVVLTSPPLTHSVGVAMANNEVDILLKKGTPLPASERSIHRTVRSLRKGEAGDVIRIPIVEGDNARWADRNRKIGELTIASDQVQRDVPAGSPVEIVIQIDESRMVTTLAHVPILSQEFRGVHELSRRLPSVAALRESADREVQRLSQVREQAHETRDPRALDILARIGRERMLEQVQSLVEASEGDPDALSECENRQLDLKAAIDEALDALDFPMLARDAEEQLYRARSFVASYGEPGRGHRLAALEQDVQKAMSARNRDALRRVTDELHDFCIEIFHGQPGFWVAYLDHLEERKGLMLDPARAGLLFSQGRRSMDTGDLEGLKAAVHQLYGLLPPREQKEVRGFGGTTQRST